MSKSIKPANKSTKSQIKSMMVICPRCDGSEEEPGAPISEEFWLCSCCNGVGVVSQKKRDQYMINEELCS